jgi:hypothetical protein
MGFISKLGLDPLEWMWGVLEAIKRFFFKIILCKSDTKRVLPQGSKIQMNMMMVKTSQLGLVTREQQKAINLTWNNHKLAKLQFFSWKINSEGLAAGSWLEITNLPSSYKCCGLGIKETT